MGQFGCDAPVDPLLEEPPGLDEVDVVPPPLGCADDAVLDGAACVVVRVGPGAEVVRSGAGADLRTDRVAAGGPGFTGGSVGLAAVSRCLSGVVGSTGTVIPTPVAYTFSTPITIRT